MSSLPVEQALQMIRSRVPAKVFHLLKDPLSAELYRSVDENPSNDEIVDVLLSLSQLFQSPIQVHHLEPVKQYLLNAALDRSEPDFQLQQDIENMTVDGVLAKDKEKGCTQDALVGALYAVSCLYPLKTPEARLASLTTVWADAAQDLLNLNS